MKKKVTIFYPYINSFGGIEKLICLLANNIDLTLVCYYDKINIKKFNLKINLINLRPKNYFQKILKLKEYFNNNEIKGLPLMWGYKSAFFAYLANVKYYAVFIADPPSLLSSSNNKSSDSFFIKLRKVISHYIDKKSINAAKVRITITKRNSLELKRIFSCNFIYFYPGFENGKIKKFSKSSKNIKLLSISRLEKSKNIDWAIKAIDNIKHKYPKIYNKIQFSIVGTGSYQLQLKRLVTQRSLENNIFFHGFISDKIKYNLLKKSHIFLMPAIQGYGIPALEALAYSNRLLINRESRISEILKNSSTICLTDNNFKSFNIKFEKFITKKNHLVKNKFNNLDFPTESEWINSIFKVCNWI